MRTGVKGSIKASPRLAIAVFLGMAAGPCALLGAEDGAAPATAPSSAVVVAVPRQAPDPCQLGEATANPTRPAWDYAASSTQCGILEADSGWQRQPIGGGVSQRMVVSSLRYGLTPRLDLRWGTTEYLFQSGGGTASVNGVGDQWLGARYRFHEQGSKTPALALLYTAKVPTASPAKGLGTGFTDHQLIFIASRDFGRNHFDFNTVGTLVGGPNGHDGAAQFGLALTRPVTPRFSAILESYGGPQPGTPNRFGAVLVAATYTLRPSLVVDSAYSRTYTAGSPRDQFLFGFTFAMRSGFAPISRGSSIGRLLGR
ncbi:MAG TPA: hypothetical protein VE291_09945 [Terracidiphilus sp.]|jgi:hypothetical protein|nr:hypothetical protein [Terracidiphilus sp.]